MPINPQCHTEECCGNCRFWRENCQECRRFPPVIFYDSEENEIVTESPMTGPNVWCGEFQPKKASEALKTVPVVTRKKISPQSAQQFNQLAQNADAKPPVEEPNPNERSHIFGHGIQCDRCGQELHEGPCDG